jgi:hypothetical protein
MPYQTWSEGNQRGLTKYGGELADCGQFAADKAGNYKVGSIHWINGDEQLPDYRTPGQFDMSHGMGPHQLGTWHTPARAQAIAYLNVLTGGFHYARIEGTGFVQTDANLSDIRGMGGAFTNFAAGPGGQPSLQRVKAQRGVQPPQTLPSIQAFRQYCDTHYDLHFGLFFWCRFED